MFEWLKKIFRDERDMKIFYQKIRLTDDEIAIIKNFYKVRSPKIKAILADLIIDTWIIRDEYEKLLISRIDWKTLEDIDDEKYNRKVRVKLSELKGRVDRVIKLTKELDSQIELSLLSKAIKDYLEDSIYKIFPDIRTATGLKIINLLKVNSFPR